jgi:hypothetical protein
VAYLNGSKVLTTGSGLTFDGANLGIGTSSPASKLEVAGTTTDVVSRITATTGSAYNRYGNSGQTFYVGLDNSTGSGFGTAYASVLYASGAYPMVFFTNANERMRLDSSGNLGLGVTNPSSFGRLAITGSATQSITVQRQNNGTSGSPVETQLIGLGGSATGGFAGMYALNSYNSDNASWLAFKTEPSGAGGVVERMRIDSSGNLGLGVTPSAWNSDYKAMQLGSGASLTGRSSLPGFELNANNFRNSGGSYIYATTAAATSYRQDSGAHSWFTAPSGTAGNAISFTQAMTLDASGNLLLGTTTQAGKLNVLTSVDNGNNTDYSQTNIALGNGAYPVFIKARRFGASYANGLDFYYTDGSTGTSTLGVRIDSSGNLGIGTSSPSASAILDAQSTTKGVRMPNMTTTQKNAIASPAAGLMVFDTTLAKLCVYTGAAWQTITSV